MVLKYLGIFFVCAVLWVTGSDVCFAADKEWLAKKKNVVVRADGVITAEYTYSFLLRHSAQEPVVVDIPRSNPETGISHVWGKTYCDGKQIIAKMKSGGLTFPEYCPNQPFEYGFTASVSSQGFDDLYADHFILEKQFGSWSYTLQFFEPQVVSWLVKGAQIGSDFPKEGQQKKSHFQWELRANPVPSIGDGRLIITSAPSWEAISRQYWLLWQGQCKSYQAPSEEALGITGENEMETVIALHRYFLNTFHYRQLRRSQHLLQPAECQEIWQRQEGDCKDLALLFHSIVTQWGIRAEVVLQAGDEYVNIHNELPDPGLFNHALVLIRLESGRYLFDPAMEKIRRYQEQDNHRLLHLSD